MTLSKMGNCRFFYSQECELLYILWKCMSQEALNGMRVIY
jgi:hypothetical protein